MRLKNLPLFYGITIVIAFGAFVFGYSLVSISMMSDMILANLPMSEQQFNVQLSTITTLLSLGAFVGTFASDALCKSLGQNKSMIYLNIFAIVCCAIQAYQIELWNLYIGRFLLGLYVGINTAIIPVYLVSISPPELTGQIGTFNQLFITIGIATAYGLGNTNISFGAYMFLPAFLCAIKIALLNYFKFDTLQRHFRKGQRQKLQEYIQMFYEAGSVQQLQRIRNFKSLQSLKITKNQSQSCCNKLNNYLTSNAPKKVVILMIVLAIANQFSGVNAIIFYAKQVFEMITHNNKETANWCAFGLGMLQVVVTFISGFLINKYGRRTLMLFGEFFVVGSLFLGYFFYQHVKKGQSYVILMVFVHIIGFSLSLGPVCMLYIAQIMQNITLAVILLWLFTLVVSMASPIMIKAVGIGYVFLFYSLVSLACTIYFYYNMVESKGLSRDTIVNTITKQERQGLQRTSDNQLQEVNSD